MRKFISIITALVIGLIALAPASAQTQVQLPALTARLTHEIALRP